MVPLPSASNKTAALRQRRRILHTGTAADD
jgi:hypothetical protein